MAFPYFFAPFNDSHHFFGGSGFNGFGWQDQGLFQQALINGDGNHVSPAIAVPAAEPAQAQQVPPPAAGQDEPVQTQQGPAAAAAAGQASPPTPAAVPAIAGRLDIAAIEYDTQDLQHRPVFARTGVIRPQNLSVPTIRREIFLLPYSFKSVQIRFGYRGEHFRVMIPDMSVRDLKTRIHNGERGDLPRLKLGGWSRRGLWFWVGVIEDRKVWDHLRDPNNDYVIQVEYDRWESSRE